MRRLLLLPILALAAACGGTGGLDAGVPPTASAAALPNSPSADPCNNAFKTQMEQRHAPPAMQIDTGRTYTATIKTARGDIVVALDPKAAPVTVNNFVYLARNGFYNCLRFHRVVPGFVIQGGDPLGNGTGGPGYTLPPETNSAQWLRGSLGMASGQGQNGTNGSQFFILTGDATYLSGSGVFNHFGSVSSGMDVADKIQQNDEIQEIDVAEG
jgi:cyclophilin family peptidyl-prolyl cis-trans isomerase